MVLRSRSAPLVTHRSSAVSQVRSQRGWTSRRIARLAWNRSRVSSETDRDSARVSPAGWTTNWATARRAISPPRARRLIVSTAVGASPVNRLLMLTPSSTSRPRPVDRSASITAASAGRLATITLSRARSYQRNAGIPSMTPCRMPIWLAGVVAGSFGVHSRSRWRARPDPSGQGRHRARGDAPSAAPGTEPRRAGRTARRRRPGRRASAGRRRLATPAGRPAPGRCPALPNHPSTVLTSPTTTATTNAGPEVVDRHPRQQPGR